MAEAMIDVAINQTLSRPIITSGVESTAAEMQCLGKSFEYHIYPHATHVFLQFQDLGGNTEAVADAWPRAMRFIREHRKPD
jgi:dienelactone hydrolase